MKPTSECNFIREAEEMADAAVLRGVCLSAHLRCHLSFAQFPARKGQGDGGREGLVELGSVKNSQSPFGASSNFLPRIAVSESRTISNLSKPACAFRSLHPPAVPPPSVGRTRCQNVRSFFFRRPFSFTFTAAAAAAMYSVARSGGAEKFLGFGKDWWVWCDMV